MSFFKQYHQSINEKSHYVDGTYISKYSEKELNSLATSIYYFGLGSAIIILILGGFACIKSIFDIIQNPDNLWMFFVILIGSVVIAFMLYGLAVIFSSIIRVVCNISLSLKRLNETPTVVQQSQQSKLIQCPECGTIIPVGMKCCPECGCPID